MDFSSIVEIGLVSGTMSFFFAFLSVKLSIGPIMDRANQEVDAYIAGLPDKIAQDTEFRQKALNLVANSIMELTKNQKFMDDLMQSVFSGAQGGGQAKEKTVNLPLLGKVPLSTILGFLGKRGESAATGAVEGAANSLLK